MNMIFGIHCVNIVSIFEFHCRLQKIIHELESIGEMLFWQCPGIGP